jgi:N-acetylglucosamine-6-phosphate deacetylase
MRLGVAKALVGGEWVDGDVEVRDGIVAAVGVGAPGGSKLAVPGFVDLQVNGYAGVDFSAPGEDGYARAGARLLADGVTAFQPTLVTARTEEMSDSLAAITAAAEGGGVQAPATSAESPAGPRFIGVHLEGPFLSRERAGAHDREALRDPDPGRLGRLLAGGRVSQMTLAPELPGALALVEELVGRDVTVSCGHTEADAAAAHAAFDRGARAVTHLFNAMRRPEHRDPGIAYAALGRDDVFVTLIVDGHHLADDTVRAAARAAGERLVLITDAVAAAAARDGEYTLGGKIPIRSEGGVVRNAAGSLAGSTLTMLDAVRNLHALGVPLAAVLTAATEAPARMARRQDLGRIEPGAAADLLVLTADLELDQVLLAGEPVSES